MWELSYRFLSALLFCLTFPTQLSDGTRVGVLTERGKNFIIM
jgi:hypothetical protein